MLHSMWAWLAASLYGSDQLVPKYSWDIPGCLVAVPTLAQWNAALNCEFRVRCLSAGMDDVLLAIALVRQVLDGA
jgi:hypothetical protein